MARRVWRDRFDNDDDDDDDTDPASYDPVESDAGPEWAWLERNYQDMASVAARSGAGFAILLVPYPGQVAKQGPDPVADLMRTMAGRHGWTVVDPVATFRAADPAASRLFVDQWHPTAAGHRILADEVLRTLACSGALGVRAGGAC
jgi:hypothetical protein